MELNEAFELIIKDKQRSMTIVLGVMILCSLGCYLFNAPYGYYLIFTVFSGASVLDWLLIRYRVSKGYYGNNEFECREIIAKAMELQKRWGKII